MIWTVRIECVRGRYLEDQWVRVYEVDSQSSLFDVHGLIRTAADFDADHLFEFFAGRNPRHRGATFGDEEEFEDDSGSWEEITLEQVFPLPKNFKLYYHFDFGDDWYFEIRRGRAKPKPPEPGVNYPRLIEAVGPDLQQYGDFQD